MRSDKNLRKWYRIINRRFFDGACFPKVCVRWANSEEESEKRWEQKYFAIADDIKNYKHENQTYHKYVIILSRAKIGNSRSLKLSTLAHEMIHIATELRDSHGPAFERWRQFIADKGIFKKHALQKDMTLF